AQLFLAVATVAGCTSTSQQITGPEPASKCSASVTSTPAEFGAEGGDGRLTVTTDRNCSWKAQTDAGWVTITPSGATQGSGTAPFTVATTNDPVAPTASLAVSNQRVTITQRAAACRYRLSVQELSLPAPGGGGAVDVTASSTLCEWS